MSATAPLAIGPSHPEYAPGPWREGWDRLRRDRVALAGAVVVIAVILLAIIGPWLTFAYSGSTYDGQDLEHRLADPTVAHPLGTDILGRDVLTRMLYGSRISLSIGVLATLISVLVGVAYGSVSGYAGGAVDEAMMRVVDILYSLPTIMLIVVLMALFERTFFLLLVALSMVGWLDIARIVRGQVLSLKHEQYVEAARTIGVSNVGVIFRHIVPNAIGPVFAYALLTVPSVILAEAFLSFLGLGVQPPTPSWGVMASDGAQVMAVHPIMLIAPSLWMTGSLVGLNFFAQGLKEALDRS
jgi:oligopeptide transport system permease protein